MRRILLTVVGTIAAACAEPLSGEIPGGADAGQSPGAGECFQDRDCATGLECRNFQCVLPDGAPPEDEEPRTFLRPVATDSAVFALSPGGDLVTRMNPETLELEAIRLPDEPVSLAVAANRDAAVILSRAGKALSWLETTSTGTVLRSQELGRKYASVALSPDNRWALAWTPDGEELDAGAEGLVALVDVEALAAGTPEPPIERAVGRRFTNVAFRKVGSVARDVVIVGSEEVAVFDLSTLPTNANPRRIPLPAAFSNLSTREAVSSPVADWILFRSDVSTDLGIFDIASRSLSSLTLPGAPSDLDLAADGSFAVAVLRGVGQVATFPLPAALTDPSLVVTRASLLPALDCDGAPPCTTAAGQAELSPDGRVAALFTTARVVESFALLTLADGSLRVFDSLEKRVRSLGISADGKTAIVLHSPQSDSTVADPYERNVDKSEGYSIVDLTQGYAQLKLTDTTPPVEFVFNGAGTHAAVTLRNDTNRAYSVDAIDLRSLVVSPLALASAPQFAGPFPGNDARVWVTQVHAAGRISFVDLAARRVRTATGYELNSEIER